MPVVSFSYRHALARTASGAHALGSAVRGVGQSYSSVGNVIVEIWQPFAGEPTFDTEAAVALLRDRASEAKGRLVDALTADPPAAAETPAAVDPAAPWSEWRITADGVGPVRLGVELDQAIAAVPGGAGRRSRRGWWADSIDLP